MGHLKRPWLIFALIAGAMVVSFFGLFGVSYFRALKIIDDFEIESKRRSQEWARAGGVRPPVFGGPFEGNAWDVYQPVLAGWSQLPGTRLLLVPGKRWQELKEADFLPTMISSIDTLRRALGTAARAPGLNLELAIPAKDTCISLLYAVQLLETERPDACLELVTVLVGLKQDMRRTFGADYPPYDGSNLQVDSWKNILENHRLPAATLKELSHRLEALHRTLPTAAEMLRAEMTTFRPFVHKAALSGKGMGTPDWKVFWSSTINAAAVLNRIEEAGAHVEPLLHLPRAERVAKLDDKNLGSKVRILALDLCVREDDWVKEYAAVRLAVALARFEMDRGAFPSQLADLVPGYLDALPQNLPVNFEVHYESGKLTIKSESEQEIWTVRRAGR